MISLRYIGKPLIMIVLLVTMMNIQTGSSGSSNISTGMDLKPNQIPNVKLGLLVPFTGSLAIFGETVNNSAHMALSDLNVLYPGINFSFETRDTASTVTTTTAAATDLVASGVTGVIGPAGSSYTEASMSIFSTSQIPQISYASTDPNIAEALGSDYLFRNAPSEEKQGIAAADIANIFVSNMSMIGGTAQWWIPNLDAFVANYKGTLLADVRYAAGELDFSAEVTTLLADNPIGIYIGGGDSTEISKIITELEIQNYRGIILGMWDVVSTASSDGSLNPNFIEGVLGTAPQGLSPNFVNRYFSLYGSNPIMFGDNTYDAVMMMGAAINDSITFSGPDVRASLFNIGNGYQGESGEITFDSNGELISGHYAIQQIQVNNFVVESPVVGQWFQSSRSVTLMDSFDTLDIVETDVVTVVTTTTETVDGTITTTGTTFVTGTEIITQTNTVTNTNTVSVTTLVTETTVSTSVFTSTFTDSKSEVNALGSVGIFIVAMFLVTINLISRRFKRKS